MKNNKKAITFIEIVIIIALIFILAIMDHNKCIRKCRPPTKQKLCMSNMRVMMGAIEMYNMDHDEKIDMLDIDLLIKQGYLKPISYPDSRCSYYTTGSLFDNGEIACKYHGTVNKPNEVD